jgi:predicted RNase H-like nuclease
MIAGADGYRKQWLVAMEHAPGRTAIEVVPTIDVLLSRAEIEVLVIDVPIGLLDEGRRACDVAARRMIGPRRNSVFTAPIRPMLGAETWEEACQRRHEVEGKRCSRQTFGILPLIRAVDHRMNPELQRRVREGHPEVSFTVMTGAPMAEYKGTPGGRRARLEVLRREFPDIDERIAEFGRPGALIDVLDAYAMLWTARRVRDGLATVLPDEVQYDARGLRAEIVA